MRELLERLCALNAVSSWEDEVRAFLLAEVEPHADRLRVDALGNLIAWKKGRKHTGSKLLLTCLLYTSPSPRDYAASRMPSSA